MESYHMSPNLLPNPDPMMKKIPIDPTHWTGYAMGLNYKA